MFFLISLAWKNLFRYKKRTIITASALAFGIGLYIFTAAWLLGVEIDSERNLIEYETSSARIMHKDYWENKDTLDLKYNIKNPDEIIKNLKLQNRNLFMAKRTVFEGEIILYKDPFPEDGSLNIKITAIDPEKDIEVFKLGKTVIQGKFLESGQEEVLIGQWLAEDLGAKPGYPIRIATRTKFNQRQLIDLNITGIINCPNPLINRTGIFIPIDIADHYLEMEGSVTEININIPKIINNEKTISDIKETIKKQNSLDILSWKKLGEDALAMAESKRSSNSIILILIFIIASVGISNTMLMAIYERTKEIGMLRSLGMNKKEILINFSIEAAFIALLGAFLGLILGTILSYWIINYGIDYTKMLRQMDAGYRVTGVLKGTWNFKAMIMGSLFGILVAIISAIIPAKRALKMKISDCLRDK